MRVWAFIVGVLSVAHYGCCEDDDVEEMENFVIGNNDWDYTESKRIHILFSGYR